MIASVIWCFALFALVAAARKILSRRLSITLPKAQPIYAKDKSSGRPDLQLKSPGEEQLKTHKQLYHELQNLELHPEVLPTARQTLLSVLCDGLRIEQSRQQINSILTIEEYDEKALLHFLGKEQGLVTNEWEVYNARRAAGGARELFADRDAAIDWLKQHAPVKYVDGAWLGHIHQVTTPFPLRDVTKDAWQILSEELGDGDLEKNHVYVYERLLHELGVYLPSAYDPDFIHPRHGLTDASAWKAAMVQLLISLFPHDFLPEILGFNMHYELLTLETLLAAKELPELGISGYYFSLHVSIDNSDSGHTAMACGTVSRYMEIVRRDCPSKAGAMWRRIQAGYILSKVAGEQLPLSSLEQQVIRILRQKGDASHQIHCPSPAKIGGQPIAQWLAPNQFSETENGKRALLQDLANARPWVVKGRSDKSMLIRELSWRGKMFGAFTDAESQDMRRWIDGLNNGRQPCEHYALYSSMLRLPEESATRAGSHVRPLQPSPEEVSNLAGYHPVFSPQPMVPRPQTDAAAADATIRHTPMNLSHIDIDSVLPLWFTHSCLLQNMVSTPHRTATRMNCHVLRILRAESGFLQESDGVAGMDEQLRAPRPRCLITIGLGMVGQQCEARPVSLQQVLEDSMTVAPEAVRFSKEILSLSQRPMQNETLLLGFALAFLDFESAVAELKDVLAPGDDQILQHIVARKRASAAECISLMAQDGAKLRECEFYYSVCRQRIDEALVRTAA